MKVNKEPSYKKRLGYHAGLLGLFSMMAAMLLMMGNVATKDEIKLRLEEDLLESLAQVVPQQVHDNNLLDNIIELSNKNETRIVYQAIKENQVTAVAYKIHQEGYSGIIEMIIGISSNGKILGVRVISHTETPGLGDKIEIEKDDWIKAFDNLMLGSLPMEKWAVKKDGGHFDQFSGATITPRAVVKAVKNGLIFFKQNRSKLLLVEKKNDKS